MFKIYKKNLEFFLLVSIVALILIAVVVVPLSWEVLVQMSTAIDVITIYFAGITMVFTLINVIFNVYKKMREKEEVRIFLQNGDDNSSKKELTQTIIRAKLTRAELKGCLNDFYGGGQFRISYLADPEFSRNLIKVQQGKCDEIVIKLDSTEQLGRFNCWQNFVSDTIN